MFNVPDELVKTDDFIKDLIKFCNDRGYEVSSSVPSIYFNSPEGSKITFDASFKHKLNNH